MTISLSDLMKELQAGEEARAKVPALESRIRDLNSECDTAMYHNQQLEENIVGYKRTIETLTQKVARLEVERDDAGFRELEAQDKLNTLLSAIGGVVHDLSTASGSVNHPKPEPTAQAPVQDASVSMNQPIDKPMKGFPGDPIPGNANIPITAHGAERATDPTVGTTVSPSETAAGSGVNATSSVSDDATKDQSDPQAYRPFEGAVDGPKPYAGKFWYERPSDVSNVDWVAGGGQL